MMFEEEAHTVIFVDDCPEKLNLKHASAINITPVMT